MNDMPNFREPNMGFDSVYFAMIKKIMSTI